ncbi:MAG: phosphoesterase PA-phosphatase, partial [Blastococcus sp.]|nr:phosphoesterase PA-phosphatase [Blastococcus sp.]
MTSGVVHDAGPRGSTSGTPVGRPSWWAMLAALVVGCLVTLDLLTYGASERFDVRVSDVVEGWGLADSAAYPLVWVVTQIGGRGTILVVLAGLVGYLAWTRRTLL